VASIDIYIFKLKDEVLRRSVEPPFDLGYQEKPMRDDC
jgi:hypothetical protein